MKKAICLGIVLSFLIVFFSFSINAETLHVRESVFNSQASNNVTVNSQVTRLDYVNQGTAAAANSSYIPYLVCVSIYNGNSKAALVDYSTLDINFTNNTSWVPIIQEIVNYSTDLQLVINPNFHFVPSAELSYGNGVVVPPHETVSLIAEVRVSSDWRPTTNDYSAPVLSSVSLSSFYVTLGNYPYGNSVDLTSVISVLNDVDTNTDQIEALLSDIKTRLTFTGTISGPYSLNYSYKNYTFSNLPSNVTGQIRIIRLSSYPVINENEWYGGNTQYSSYEYCIPYEINFYINNNTNYALTISAINILNLFTKDPGKAYELVNVSHDYMGAFLDTNNNDQIDLYIHSNITDKTYRYLPVGATRYTFYIKCYSNNLTSVNYNDQAVIDCTINTSQLFLYNNEYIPLSNIDKNVKALLDSYLNVNSGSISSDSGTVESQSDSNHTIEESYYSANSDAILATGLSNYRFSNDQSNGIGSVSNDFTAVWNALGSFNSIYIFSLTLSIALMIFRHVPGVIRRRLNTRNDGDE